MQKIKSNGRVTLILVYLEIAFYLMLFIFGIYSIIAYRDITKEKRIIREFEKSVTEQVKLGIENPIVELISVLKKHGIRHPQYVVLQILHETGGLTSKVYEECNNLFGMKHNTRKYSRGVCRGHARYEKVLDSVKDYKEWQDKYLTKYENKRNIKVKTLEDYIAFLKASRYAEDPSYGKKLKLWEEYINSITTNYN